MLLELLINDLKLDADAVKSLAFHAKANKLYYAFLIKISGKTQREWVLGELKKSRLKRKEYISHTLSVLRALSGLKYSLFKFRKPIPHLSVDLDILIHSSDISRAVSRLRAYGFSIEVKEPYTVTLRKNDFIVDLYTHPAFAWIVYMDGEKLLREYVEDYEVEGVAARALARSAEVVVTAAHAIYKEHIVLLLDCLVLWRWFSRRVIDIAEEFLVKDSLLELSSICDLAREGSVETPYRIPFSKLITLYLRKSYRDPWFRGTLPNILKYIALHEKGVENLVERLKRKTY